MAGGIWWATASALWNDARGQFSMSSPNKSHSTQACNIRSANSLHMRRDPVGVIGDFGFLELDFAVEGLRMSKDGQLGHPGGSRPAHGYRYAVPPCRLSTVQPPRLAIRISAVSPISPKSTTFTARGHPDGSCCCPKPVHGQLRQWREIPHETVNAFKPLGRINSQRGRGAGIGVPAPSMPPR